MSASPTLPTRTLRATSMTRPFQGDAVVLQGATVERNLVIMCRKSSGHISARRDLQLIRSVVG